MTLKHMNMAMNQQTTTNEKFQELAAIIQQQMVTKAEVLPMASVADINSFLHSPRLEAIMLDCLLESYESYEGYEVQISLLLNDQNLRSEFRDWLARRIYDEVNLLAT
jgi:hypothetical protein